MPIGLVNDEQFELELENLTSKKESHAEVDAEICETPTRGRSVGDTNIPDSLRKIIGEEAVINGRGAALDLAARFGVSASSASAYAKGATSTTSYNEPKKGIVEFLNKSRARAVKKANKTLNAALSAISQEKLDYTDAKDLSSIAKDMSVIIKNLEPQEVPQDSGVKNQQFVIYAPTFKKEEAFDVIDVGE